MNRYLANIAARNTQDNTQSVIPATSAPAVFEEGLTAVENNDVQQDVPVQKNLAPVDPIQIQPLKKSEINDGLETPLPEKSTEISYITRHTERLSNLEAGNALQNNLLETEEIKFAEPSKKIVAVAKPVNPNENEPTFINTTGLNALHKKKGGRKQTVNKTAAKPGELNEVKKPIIEQKQFITPSITEIQRINNVIPNKIGVQRIVPNLDGNANNRHIHNKKQQANPKLVIGKITVEILPPIATASPKTITKVVSQTSKPTSSKSNKLIFGLGQM